MKTVIVYLCLAAAGYAAAIPLQKNKKSFAWIGIVLMLLVRGLVLLMGFRIGANEEVVSSIGTIGVQSLLIAMVSLLFTVASVHVARRIMGFDKYGRSLEAGELSQRDTSTSKEEHTGCTSAMSVFNKSTVTMMVSVLAGFFLGFFLVLKGGTVSYETAYIVSGKIVSWGLCAMVFLVGIDMGFDGTIPTVFRRIGFKILVFPAVTAAATLAAVIICGLFTPMNLQESAAVACTFCWYTLGPNLIMEAGMTMAGAYSFLVNFLRVLLSLLTIPFVASRIGYLETVGMSCSASMDVCIATITQTAGKETAVCAFASGVLFTSSVPVVVTLILGL